MKHPQRDRLPASEIIERMKSIVSHRTGVPIVSDAELARSLDISKATLSAWKQRNSIPTKALDNFIEKYREPYEELVYKSISSVSYKITAEALSLRVIFTDAHEMFEEDNWNAQYFQATIHSCLRDEIESELRRRQFDTEEHIGSIAESMFKDYLAGKKSTLSSLLSAASAGLLPKRA